MDVLAAKIGDSIDAQRVANRYRFGGARGGRPMDERQAREATLLQAFESAAAASPSWSE